MTVFRLSAKSALCIATMAAAVLWSGSALGQRRPRLPAQQFLADVLAKNEAKLFDYVVTGADAQDDGKLPLAISELLYEPGRNGYRSAIEISKLDKILIKAIPQSDKSVIVIFYPRKYKAQIDRDVRFLESQWMKKYFACRFRLTDQGWKMEENFCFAGTDGPFPAEY